MIHLFPLFSPLLSPFLQANMRAARKKWGSQYFDFHPMAYTLPGEYNLFKNDFKEGDMWILKIAAKDRGEGIKVRERGREKKRGCVRERERERERVESEC